MRRIDLHQHWIPPHLSGSEFVRQVREQSGWEFPAENLPWSAEKAIAFMDRLGTETAILSLTGSPGGNGIGPENREFARRLNEYAAALTREHPGRFGFFANLPIPTDTDAALVELGHALDVLGADGVNLTSSYGVGEDARYVGHDALDPVWEELDRREAVVFLHGEQTPSATRFPSRFVPLPVGNVPAETFKAAADLVTSGKRRRWPRVRIVLAHAGGSTPFLAARCAGLSHQQGCPLSPEEILEGFAGFYYETALSGHPLNLTALEGFAAPQRILFGSDFPPITFETAHWYTQAADRFYEQRPERSAQVMRENALALFPRLAGVAS